MGSTIAVKINFIMMKNKFLKVTGVLFFLGTSLLAQQDLKQTAEGNAAFQKKEIVEAEANYREALSYNAQNPIPEYNLGTTLYRDDKLAEAEKRFMDAAKIATTKTAKHKAYHNLGNTYLVQKKYKEAVEAYKNALRNNPTDEETRYNLALAKQKQDQNGGGGGDGEDNKENQDQDQQNRPDKDKKEGDDKQDKENKGDQKDPNKKPNDKGDNPQDQQKDQQQPPQPKPGSLTPQQIKNLLKAAENEEKKSQEKLQLKEEKGQPKKTEKDW